MANNAHEKHYVTPLHIWLQNHSGGDSVYYRPPLSTWNISTGPATTFPETTGSVKGTSPPRNSPLCFSQRAEKVEIKIQDFVSKSPVDSVLNLANEFQLRVTVRSLDPSQLVCTVTPSAGRTPAVSLLTMVSGCQSLKQLQPIRAPHWNNIRHEKPGEDWTAGLVK